MAGKFLYLDSSALVKLVRTEAESAALRELIKAWPLQVSSELAKVEVVRAVRRATVEEELHCRAAELMTAINLLKISTEILNQASLIDPATVRTLDAIHLASARSLGSDLGAMAAYDIRLADAARRSGMVVLAPGQELDSVPQEAEEKPAAAETRSP